MQGNDQRARGLRRLDSPDAILQWTASGRTLKPPGVFLLGRRNQDLLGDPWLYEEHRQRPRE